MGQSKQRKDAAKACAEEERKLTPLETKLLEAVILLENRLWGGYTVFVGHEIKVRDKK